MPVPPQPVYICHLPEDEALALQLYWEMQVTGLRPWLDAQDLQFGQPWDEEVPRVIREAGALVVLVTPGWPLLGTPHPHHYVPERLTIAITSARESGTLIIPVLIDEVVAERIPFGLHRLHPIRVSAEDIAQVTPAIIRQLPNLLEGETFVSNHESQSGHISTTVEDTRLEDGNWQRIDESAESPEADTSGWLTLIHLSDVHLGRTDAGWEPDERLREGLELDLARAMADTGPIDGLAIAGNSAYSGRPAEFRSALEWLDTLVKIGGCPEGNVWIAPGPRDLRYRSEKRNSQKHRRSELTALDRSTALTYGRLQDFDIFAAHFDCHVGPEMTGWTSTLAFPDGRELNLVGAVSLDTPLEGATGRDADSAIGAPAQGPVGNCIAVELGYRPSPAQRSQSPGSSVQVQLVSHGHLEDDDGLGHDAYPGRPILTLAAGMRRPNAASPAGSFTYNILRLRTVPSSPGSVALEADLLQRVWSDEQGCFTNDHASGGQSYVRFHRHIQVPSTAPRSPRSEAESPRVRPPDASCAPQDSNLTDRVEDSRPRLDPSSYRAVVRGLWRLPVHARYQLLVEHGHFPSNLPVPEVSDPIWTNTLRRIRTDREAVNRLQAAIAALQSMVEPRQASKSDNRRSRGTSR